jgi:hypothetical protein
MQLVSTTAHVESDIVASLAHWIAEQIRKGAPRLVLAQRIADGSMQTVDEFEVHGDPLDTHAMAEVIYGAAQREAHTLRTSIAYVVLAVRPDGTGWIARFLFRVDATAGAEWMQSGESPERALVGMLMSHADTSARLSLGHSEGILKQYRSLFDQANAQNAQLLAQAQARIATLESRELEAMDLRDKLQSMAREREVEAEELKRRHQLRMAALDKLGSVAPLIFPQLARGISASDGKGGESKAEPPPSEGEAFALLEQLLVSLTSQQFQALAQLLEPHQVLLLSRLFDIVDARVKAARGGGAGGGATNPPAATGPAPSADTPASPPSPNNVPPDSSSQSSTVPPGAVP